ncbi:MAG: hypothetical protein E6H07_16245 [Bacteroidetes bacterium]|nr:MAG: hypothetical protein E6H07_16245 [Bacteroidota bacterium]
MNKLLLFSGAFIIIFSACKKTEVPLPMNEACIQQTMDPLAVAYDTNQVYYINYSGKHCGFMPFNSKNYWVYEDSIFDGNGNFKTVKIDTLRYTKTLQTPDQLIWWETKKDVGLPRKIYASENAIYGLENGSFIVDSFYTKRELYEAEKDTVNFLASFVDIVAFGKIIKTTEALRTEAGSFSNYIMLEKYAPGYRRDRVYFVPGFGVIKYTSEFYKAPGPPSNMKLFIKSTLIGYHTEN